MKELFDNEDEILGLVRKQGLLKPSADFTSRVMQSLEEAKAPSAYVPLLSRKAWIILIAGIMLLTVVCWQVLSQSAVNEPTGLTGLFERIGSYVNEIDFSFKFDANALLIITLAIISMGVLLSIDLWFSNNRRGNAI
jgi:hypothetical protein